MTNTALEALEANVCEDGTLGFGDWEGRIYDLTEVTCEYTGATEEQRTTLFNALRSSVSLELRIDKAIIAVIREVLSEPASNG